MKKFIPIILAICSVTIAHAQSQMHVKAGKVFSTFLFRNSDNNRDETLKYVANNYLGISYDIAVGQRHLFRPEIAYREAGARSQINNLKLSWDLKYFDFNFSYLFKTYGNQKFSLYQGFGPSFGYLLAGEQYTGLNYVDLKENKSLKTTDFGLNFIANAKLRIIDSLYLSVEYRYGLGLQQIEKDANKPSQVTRNRYHGVLLGLSFKF